MNYDANGQLVDGGFHAVDDAPKYKLGKLVSTDDGKTFAYVKAGADLVAGTTYKVGSINVATAAYENGQVKITATAPTIITNVKGADVEGALIKVTDSESNVKGVFAIEAASDNGTAIFARLGGVEIAATDTFAGIASNTPAIAGGAVSSGKTQGTPLAAIATGKYGWVLLQNPDAVSA